MPRGGGRGVGEGGGGGGGRGQELYQWYSQLLNRTGVHSKGASIQANIVHELIYDTSTGTIQYTWNNQT